MSNSDIFFLKEFDTQPVLEVALVDPNGQPHDLSAGDPVVKLHINLADNAGIMTRDMIIFDHPGGVVHYFWDKEDDWDAPGNLFASTAHLMEYETIRGPARLTFPNDGFHTLSISRHIADG